MKVNKDTTLITLIDNRIPLMGALKSMHEGEKDYVSYFFFQNEVKEYLTNKEIQLKANKNSSWRTDYEKIKSVYSIENLKYHGLVSVDDSKNNIYFVTWFFDMLKSLDEHKHSKPITNRTFIDLFERVKRLISEFKEFRSFNEDKKEIFIEDLNLLLKDTKESFEENRTIIKRQVDDLSKYLNEENEGGDKRKLMSQIIKLNDKYVEPFYNFIGNVRNQHGFMNKLEILRANFEDNKLTNEEMLLSKFIINFDSYKKDIHEIYNKINEYRRKGKEDLVTYNAIEKAFNKLFSNVNMLKNGRQRNKYLDSTTFHDDFELFDNLKVNNFKKDKVQINYDMLVDDFKNIEDQFFIEDENKEKEKKNEIIDISNILSTSQRGIDYSSKIRDVEGRINNLLLKNIDGLIKPDSEIDIIAKIDFLLRSNLDDYNILHTIYAYSNVRKKVDHVKVGYNTRAILSTLDGTIKYKYRPVYSLG